MPIPASLSAIVPVIDTLNKLDFRQSWLHRATGFLLTFPDL